MRLIEEVFKEVKDLVKNSGEEEHLKAQLNSSFQTRGNDPDYDDYLQGKINDLLAELPVGWEFEDMTINVMTDLTMQVFQFEAGPNRDGAGEILSDKAMMLLRKDDDGQPFGSFTYFFGTILWYVPIFH